MLREETEGLDPMGLVVNMYGTHGVQSPSPSMS